MIRVLVAVGGGLLLVWVGLVVGLLIVKPERRVVREALRILPDVLVLLWRSIAERGILLSLKSVRPKEVRDDDPGRRPARPRGPTGRARLARLR